MHASALFSLATALLLSSPALARGATSKQEPRSYGPKRTYSMSQVFRKGSLKDIIAHDQARAAAAETAFTVAPADPASVAKRSSANLDPSIQTDILLDNGLSQYMVTMHVGTPPVPCSVMVDIGSANTWVGAAGSASKYKPSASSSAVDTGYGVRVVYGIGEFNGEEYTETVSFDGEQNGQDVKLTATQQGLGFATSQQGFDGLDGVLGLAPVLQTTESLYDKTTNKSNTIPVPTITDTLFAQGQIPKNMVGISFKPAMNTSASELNDSGTLTFGGVDENEYDGEIMYFPKSTATGLDAYWGLTVDSVSFDYLEAVPSSNKRATVERFVSNEIQSQPATGILDHGYTLVALPKDVFNKYVQIVGGRQVNGLLLVPTANVPKIGNMTFTIAGNDYIFSPSAQFFPNDIGSAFTGKTYTQMGAYVSVFTDFGYGGGTAYTFGMYFLQRFYSVFDTTNQRIGLAYTPYSFEKTTEIASFRRTKRMFREHVKKTDWSYGKARLSQLSARSPFRKR